jgi:iron complex outermembrane receptor protein
MKADNLKYIFACLCLFAVFFYPNFCNADIAELSIEELMKIEVETVYGASKFEQKITEAPSFITIITADEIKKYGHRTLADILRSVGGFYITYDRNYSYIGVRGFSRTGDYNSRILILVDGYRINESLYDGVYIGTEFILDVDLIDRIEIIRGPGSSLYGNNAFLGVVNIITGKGRDIKGLEVSTEAGSLQSYKGRFTYGDRFKDGMEILLSASAYDSKGNRNLYFQEYDSIAHDLDKDKSYNVFSNISFGEFTIQGALVSRKKFVPTASYGTDFNDKQGYVSLKYNHVFEDGLEATARVNYGFYDYSGDYPYSSVINRDVSSARWWVGDLKLAKKILESHKIIFGAEYQNNIRQDQLNYDEDPYNLKLDDRRRSSTKALYIEDEFRIIDNLILNAGLRYDSAKYGSRTSPRAALIYSPSFATMLKLLYGEAFRAPNAYELFYNDNGASMKANPSLKPEVIKTYELVLEHYLKKNLRFSISGFYYTINNLIAQQTDSSDGLLVFNNADSVETKGVEFELRHKWRGGIEGSASYTFQEAKDKKTGSMLVNSPRHLAKLNTIIPLLKDRVFSGAELQYSTHQAVKRLRIPKQENSLSQT